MTKPSVASRPINILMLAELFTLPYRVLRCAAAAGGKVFILGGIKSNELVYSRYCAGFTATNEINGGYSDRLAEQVNAFCAKHNIDIVIPGDAPATRSLIAIRHKLETCCFPLPSLEQFDFLNDKWKFTRLCEELGIPHPKSWFYQDRATLEAAIQKRELRFPLIAKAMSMDGGVGCVILDNPDNAQTQLQRIDYRPIIVQELLKGEDIGASVYCEKGAINAFIAHSYHRGVYATFADGQIFDQIAKIVAHFRLDGVFNFDMIRTPNGAVSYLECNPRFFYKIALSMLAGINFVAFGLQRDMQRPSGSVPDGTAIRLGKALLKSVAAGEKTRQADFKVLRYLRNDPMPYLRERARL